MTYWHASQWRTDHWHTCRLERHCRRCVYSRLAQRQAHRRARDGGFAMKMNFRLDARRWLDVSSSVVLLMAAGMVIWRLYEPRPRPRPIVEDVDGLVMPADSSRNVRGSGRVVLVEFGDYECPFCAQHTMTTGRQLHSTYVERGILRHLFLNLPLASHPRAQKAAEASECAANQEHFWNMHDQLFAQQSSLDLTSLNARATTIGLDRPAFEACLTEGRAATRVAAQMAMAKRLGVNSTPSFFLGLLQQDGSIALRKRIHGSVPFEVFRDAIDELSGT